MGCARGALAIAAAGLAASGCFALGWDYQEALGEGGGAGSGDAGGGGADPSTTVAATASASSAGGCNGAGDPCVTGLPGACAAGTLDCAGQCAPAVSPGTQAETCNGADDDCDGAIDEADNGGSIGCPCETGAFEGHAYLFCTQLSSWQEASETCASAGYHLATIDTAAENAWILDYRVGGSGKHWFFGYTDAAQEGSWVWADGSPAGYVHWDNGEPNGATYEDCATMPGGSNGFWADDGCAVKDPFICEAP
jgi:hypothetical protein